MDVRVEGMVSKSSSRTDVAADYVDVLSNMDGDLASGASRPPFLGTYVSRSMDRKGASNKWNTTGPYETCDFCGFHMECRE